MVTPANPAIHINIVLPEHLNDKHVEALKEIAALMNRPTLPPPEGDQTPKSAKTLHENQKLLASYPRLTKLLDQLVEGLRKGLVIIAYPTLFAGGIILAFGLSQTLMIMATTFSVASLVESQALVYLILGGALYKLGQDIVGNNDLNTILGNLLYIPLPFLLRLTK